MIAAIPSDPTVDAGREAIVLGFAPCIPVNEIVTVLESHGLVHSAEISRLITPYHYFWQPKPPMGNDDIRRISKFQAIQEIDIDLPVGELLTPRLTPMATMPPAGSPARHLPMPGMHSAIIAIIDSGFDLDHPNLNYVERSLHFNAAEFFERARRRALPLESAPRQRKGFDASRSIRAHGTSVAGAAAALRRHSGEPTIDGIAPGYPIMPLKISARPTSAEVAASINWAAAHGARVINMSFKVLRQPVVNAAIENAWKRGIVLCAASGNRRSGFPFSGVDFPARHPNVIAVGAIDRRGHRKRLDERIQGDWGSQYGNELDLVAPGMEVRTLDDQGQLGALPGNYQLLSMGTSVASPQVAGLAALLFGMNPGLTNQDVRDVIEGSCLKLPDYRFRRVPGRKWSWNREVGYGSMRIGQSILVGSKRQGRQEREDGNDARYRPD